MSTNCKNIGDKSIQENLKKLDFTVRSIKPVINKVFLRFMSLYYKILQNSAAFDTLRNRYLIQRSLRDEHGNEVVKPPPGKLFISNLQEILSSRSSRSDSAKNHFERTAKEYGTTASDLSLVSRYVNVYRVSGGTKNEIYGTWAEV